MVATTRRRRGDHHDAATLSQGLLGGEFHVPLWVVLSCQAAMALGTLSGGWRIVHTMGSEITRLTPARASAQRPATPDHLFAATFLERPGVVGARSPARSSASVHDACPPSRWNVASNIVVAWTLTLPAAGLIGAGTYLLVGLFV